MSSEITVFRICKTKYVSTAFDGEGAFRFGGRWNSRGTRIIYAAGSLSLAALEMLVHLDDDSLLFEYSYVSVQIPTDLILKVEHFRKLPKDWHISPAPIATQKIGDDWVKSKISAVLEVPTSIIPLEKNYLLNPLHTYFNKILIGTPQKFRFDERLKC
jgi:RES domain-containing protein